LEGADRDQAGDASLIVAVGWSGQWAARVECSADSGGRVTAGLERTHFLLHPGERVRLPRILALRRPDSPERVLEVSLRGLQPEVEYVVSRQSTGETERVSGARLTAGFPLTLDNPPRSDAILYASEK